MIVDEPYTINERFSHTLGVYQITVDSPDINQPIHHWWAKCKIGNTRKIARLRAKAEQIRSIGLASKTEKWQKYNPLDPGYEKL